MDYEYEYVLTSDGELYHHGVKGMKWGVRRHQNKGGSPTNKSHSQRENNKTAALANKGKQYVQKIDSKKVLSVVASTSAVASGVLWAASAFVPNTAGITFMRGSLSALSAAMSLADNVAPSPNPKHGKRK